MSLQNTLDTVAQTSSTISSLVSKTFRIKLFFIVGVISLMLGLGIGLTVGVYYGYTKWTKKADKAMELYESKYRGLIIETIKEKAKRR